jgi:hypothetical protein
VLKERISNGNGEERLSFKKTSSGEEKRVIVESAHKIISSLTQEKFNQKSEKSLLKPGEKGLGSKIAIPKLNLEVLPNYHKKSEKCLNDMLLIAYNEKHGAEKRLL